MKNKITFLTVTALSLVCIMFFIAFGCGKQNSNLFSNADDDFEFISMQADNNPLITRASLVEEDKAILDQRLSKYTAFTMDKRELAAAFSGDFGNFRLQIDKDLDWAIYLEKNDLRAPHYKAVYVTDAGDIEINEPFVVNTYKGETTAGQHARFTIDENTFNGVIFGENYHYVIRQTSDYTQNRADNSFIVYKSWDIIPDDNFSDYLDDALEVPADGREVLVEQVSTRSYNPLLCDYTLKVATEADYSYYSKHGSSTNSVIISVLNVVEGAYESNFLIRFRVTTQIIQASNNTYASTDASVLLDQFRDYWKANRTGVDRHIAHLFTGKTLNSNVLGVAWKGAINGNSSNNYAYALSMDYYSSTHYIVAHEIGHNLNASHPTQSDCNCSNSWTATIMCGVLTSAPSIQFCQQSRTEIVPFIIQSSNSHTWTCLDGPSVITSSAYYFITNPPLGTITWSVTGPFVVSNSTGNSTTVTRTGSGSGTVNAWLYNANGSWWIASRSISN